MPAVHTVSQHLRRGLLFISVTERAKTRGRGDYNGLAAEIGGAARAVCGNNHPPARNRVFTKFWQLVKALCRVTKCAQAGTRATLLYRSFWAEGISQQLNLGRTR